MQDRPSAAELLDAIAELLEGDVLKATSGGLKHQVRVAGNLCRILQREAELGAANERRAATLLSEVLCDANDGDLAELNARMAARIRDEDAESLERAAWGALVEIVRGKLAIDKPGHDAYDFAPETGS
jgi:hypothetical protein